MGEKHVPRPTKFKSKALAVARKLGREVVWKDNKGLWHASTNRDNTPHYAVEIEDVEKQFRGYTVSGKEVKY